MENTIHNQINSEDQIFEITSSLFTQHDVDLNGMRRWVRIRCSDDKYYKLFDHLIKFYYEVQYREYELYLGYDIYNRFEKNIQIIEPVDEDLSFYSFSLRDFCQRLNIDIQKFEYALSHIGVNSARLEFSGKIINFKVMTFISSLEVVLSEQSLKVFLMLANNYAKNKAVEFEKQYFPEKKPKTKTDNVRPIKFVSVPMGGQNGKKHH